MRNLSKKAISELVATVIMITLAIASASIVSYFVIPMLSQSVTLSPTVSCIELKTNSPINIEKSCYNQETKEIELTIKRTMSSINVSEISFIFRTNSNIKTFKCSESCRGCKILNPGSEKKYFFDFTEFKENVEISYIVDNCEMNTIKISQIC